MAKAPYFPWLVRDWLCSRKVKAMSGDAVKAYVYLLSQSWLEEPRATLPTKDADLAAIAMIDIDKWYTIKHEVLQHFELKENDENKGYYYNEKLFEISCNYQANQRFGNKNAKRSRKNTKPNARLDIDNANDFNTFWKEYPRKEAKARAVTAWKKIKKPKETLALILKALLWQKKTEKWTKDGGQYIPHPATYLNGECWKDEPLGQRGNSPKTLNTEPPNPDLHLFYKAREKWKKEGKRV